MRKPKNKSKSMKRVVKKNPYKCRNCLLELSNSSSFILHRKDCNLTKKDIFIIRYEYVYNELSARDIEKKYNISNRKLTYLLNGLMRDKETARALSLSKIEPHIHSAENLDNISNGMLKGLRDKPNYKFSYISDVEQRFQDIIVHNKWDIDYLIIKDKSVEYDYQSYKICFAFENQRIAIELDMEQDSSIELKEIKKLITDYKRVKIQEMIKDGWKVFRYSFDSLDEVVIRSDLEQLLNKDLEDSSIKNGVVIEKKQIDLKKDRNIIEKDMYGGQTKKAIMSRVKLRKVVRPSYKVLMKLIKEHGYAGVGRIYGLSGNGIRKWVLNYEKNGCSE